MKPFSAASGRQHDALSRYIVVAALLTAVLAGLVAERIGLGFAIALPLAVGAAAYAVSDYKAALWISALVLPLASTYLLPSKMLGISGFSPLNLIVALSLVALLLHPRLRKTKLLTPPWPAMFFLFVFLFVAGGIHGALYATSIPAYFREMSVTTAGSVPTYLLEVLLKPLETLAIVYMLSIGVRNVRKPALFLVPIFLSAACIACAVLFVAAASPLSLAELSSQQNRNYLSSLGMHANELGLLLNMAAALALLCLFQCDTRAVRWALGLLSAILASAVVLTFSRGAYLGLLAVLFYALFVNKRVKSAIALVLVIVAGVAFNPGPVTERVAQGMDSKDPDAISSGRVREIWLPLLSEVRQSPLIGNGLSSIMWSKAARQREILPVGHPHSAFLGALLDFGLLGSLIIAAFFIHMWRLFRRLSRHAADPLWRGVFSGAMACILLLLVQGISDDSFVPTRTQPFLWLAYGCAVGLAARGGRA